MVGACSPPAGISLPCSANDRAGRSGALHLAGPFLPSRLSWAQTYGLAKSWQDQEAARQTDWLGCKQQVATTTEMAAASCKSEITMETGSSLVAFWTSATRVRSDRKDLLSNGTGSPSACFFLSSLFLYHEKQASSGDRTTVSASTVLRFATVPGGLAQCGWMAGLAWPGRLPEEHTKLT